MAIVMIFIVSDNMRRMSLDRRYDQSDEFCGYILMQLDMDNGYKKLYNIIDFRVFFVLFVRKE